MKTITLINTDAGWIAKFTNSPEVVKQLGTDTIPTPFTSRAGWAMVLQSVKDLNPDHNVVIG